MLIDTHCHVNFNAYRDDSDAVVQRSLAQGIRMIVVGSQYDTSQRAVETANRYNGVWAAVALHPLHLIQQERDENELHFTTREERFDYNAYRLLATSSEKVVAIGECGLDYYRMPKSHDEANTKRLQQETFLQHMKLAQELKLILMVHCRDAYEDVYELLKIHRESLSGIAMHSYIGGVEMAEKFLQLGCFLSFNGIITYKPRKEILPGSAHPELREVVRRTPLDRILLETDAPYLSPEGLRGKRNEPVNVQLVAEKISALKGIGLREVEEQTSRNAVTLFGLKET